MILGADKLFAVTYSSASGNQHAFAQGGSPAGIGLEVHFALFGNQIWRLKIYSDQGSQKAVQSISEVFNISHLKKKQRSESIWQHEDGSKSMSPSKSGLPESFSHPQVSPGPQDMVKLLLHPHFRPQAVWTSDIAGPWWTSSVDPVDPLTGPWPLLCGLELGRR